MSEGFYITTAIDYLNGQPHLGHAYEKIITDVIARARRSLGQKVFFLTGLDEHGQKVQQSAIEAGKDPQAYCDELAASWRKFADHLNISIDDFIRTTDDRHKQVVQALLSKLHRDNQFYRAEYSGFYSTRQETFLTDRDRGPDGRFDPAFGEVLELVEQNYFFNLKDHQQWLINHIESHPSFIAPDYRRNEVLGFLKNHTLEDLCISRPKARLNWGIPLPFDPDYVTFVWFDALTNYITVPAAHGDATVLNAIETGTPRTGISLWPADIHVIGKDILKFHAVYWPIMLKAAGLPLPRQILAHGFWQKDGAKISKTTGNIVDPVAVIRDWSVDAFRYYVVRELDIGPDGNWTDAGFEARYNAELANGLGNLLNRSLSMLMKYREGVLKTVSDELSKEAATFAGETVAHFREHRLQCALESAWKLVNRANLYVEQTLPFKMAKDPAQAGRLDAVLYNLVESCRILAVLLWPVIPGSARAIYQQIGLEGVPDRFEMARWAGLPAGHTITGPQPLFPKKQ